MLEKSNSLIGRPSLKGGVFSALVVNNNDPKKIGRVKVRISELHREYSDNDLPWAPQIQFGWGNGQTGQIFVPEIGSRVWVMFTDDDGYNLFYLGGSIFPDTQPTELSENYPNLWGWVDRHNNVWKINFATGQVLLHHKSGTVINIDGSGNLTITAANTSVNVNGNAQVAVSGTLNVLGAAGINANGATIHLNSGGAPTVAAMQPRPALTPVDVANKEEY